MRRRFRPHAVMILSAYALGALLLRYLPDLPSPLTVGAPSGVPAGRLLAAFLLPTAAALTCLLLDALIVRHPLERSDANSSLAVYDAIMLRIVAFMTALHATVLLGLAGLLSGRTWAPRIVPVMLGLTLIAIGNLLPRTRPNPAIGIATPSLLADRDLWIRIHRTAGYLVVCLGCVILIGGAVVPAPLGPRMGRLVEPALLFGIPALVIYSRRLVRMKGVAS